MDAALNPSESRKMLEFQNFLKMDEFVACVSKYTEGGLPIYAFLSIYEICDRL